MKTGTIIGIVAVVVVVASIGTYGTIVYVRNKRSGDAEGENTGGDNNTGNENTGGENTGGESIPNINLKKNDIFKTADSADVFIFLGSGDAIDNDAKKNKFHATFNQYWENIIPIIISKQQADSIPLTRTMGDVETLEALVNMLVVERNKATGAKKASLDVQLIKLSKDEAKKLNRQFTFGNGKWYTTIIPPPPPPLTDEQKEINAMANVMDGYLIGMAKHERPVIAWMYDNNRLHLEQAYGEMQDRLPIALDYLVSKGVEFRFLLYGDGSEMRIGNKDFVPNDAYANALASKIKAIALTQGGGMGSEFNDYFGANFLSWDEIGQQALFNQIKKVYIYKLLKKFGYTYANGVATKSLSFSFSKQNNNFADNFRSL